MTTTQHPLTDETRDRLVSYISGGTIDCSSAEGRYDSLTEDDARRIVDSLWGPMTEAAFDAGREHEREHAQAHPAEVTAEMRRVAASAYEDMAQVTRPENHEKCLNAALSAALAVATLADPRRWRECRFEDIQQGERARWALPADEHGTFEMTEGVAHEMRRRKGDREWVDAGGCTVACAPAHGTDGFRYWRLAGHENTAPTSPAENARPWEPLHGPVCVGDEVRQELNGVTVIATVGRVDANGDPWTTERRFIGVLEYGTWYVRRAVQDLPTKPGTVIVPADGYEHIEAEVSGIVWRAREAILSSDSRWYGVWRAGQVAVGSTSADSITPGPWKVEGE